MFARLSNVAPPSQGQLISIGSVLFFVFVAVLGGVVVGSGNLLWITLACSVLIGGLLLGTANIVVWIILLGTLVISGPLIMNYPELRRMAWLFSMLGFLLIASAVIHIGSNRRLPRNPPPEFVTIALALLAYVGLLLLFADGSSAEKVGAIKRYFQYWGVFLAFTVIPFSPVSIKRWAKLLVMIALIQLPFAVYQLVVLVPLRMNMPERVVPIDIVTGTLEADLWGAGNNNTMIYMLLVVGVALVSAYRDKALIWWKFWPMLAIVLTPLALGETKMALVFLPLAFLAVFGDMVRSRPGTFAAASVVAMLLLGGLFYVYVGVMAEDQTMTFQQKLEMNIEYNFGDAGYNGGGSLNRATAVPFWWKRNGLNDPAGTLFGHGMGASFTSDDDTAGHEAKKYPGYVIGLTGLSIMLWDFGLLGTALFIGTFVAAAWTAAKLIRQSTTPFDRAFCRALLASALILIANIAMADTMMVAPSTEVLAALTLGMIAWRWRQVGSLQ